MVECTVVGRNVSRHRIWAYNLDEKRGKKNVFITMYVCAMSYETLERHENDPINEHDNLDFVCLVSMGSRSSPLLHVDFSKAVFLTRFAYIILPDPKSLKKNRTVSHKNEHRLKFAPFSREKVNPKSTKMSPTWCFASDTHGHVLCFWMPCGQAYIPLGVRTCVWNSKRIMTNKLETHPENEKEQDIRTGDSHLASPKSPGTCVWVLYSPTYIKNALSYFGVKTH